MGEDILIVKKRKRVRAEQSIKERLL